MFDAYRMADNATRKLNRKQKKRWSRAEKVARKSLVRFAGEHGVNCAHQTYVAAHVAPADTWNMRKPARVPRSLRFALGRRTGGALRSWRKLSKSLGNIWAYAAEYMGLIGGNAIVTTEVRVEGIDQATT